jgi:hypothetical protein
MADAINPIEVCRHQEVKDGAYIFAGHAPFPDLL